MRDALLKLVEAAETRVSELTKLAESADDRGAHVIEVDAMKWRKLADNGREALDHVACNAVDHAYR